jgi:hypothetical protein
MKRRPYGVNLDDGVALSTEEEFNLLFINARPESRDRLQTWLSDNEQDAILFSGQIGTGKTTLLNEILRKNEATPVIRMRFDTNCIDATEGGYALLLLGEILQACIARSVDPVDCGIALSDFKPIGASDWGTLSNTLTSPPENLTMASKLQGLATLLTPIAVHVLKSAGVLLDRLISKTGRRPVLVADGVDKFNPNTADYVSLKNTLKFLGEQKTLFEVNVVHLFLEDNFHGGISKLFIGGLPNETLLTIFEKRLGPYAPMYREAFALLAEYSGGNLRQGLRLLNSYYFQRTQQRKDSTAALAMACQRVSSDLLGVPFGLFPSDVARVVKKNGYLEGSLLQDRMTSAGANEAIYHNWIFLNNQPIPDAPTRWPAQINPLIDRAIDWKAETIPTPEEQAVRNWAHEHEVSPLGLNVRVDENGEPEWSKFWEQIKSSSSSELNILHLLEEIGAGLFGAERQDRIIVAYKERGNLEAVRDFLIGKANTYGNFPCKEIELTGGDGKHPVQELITLLAKPETQIIYSVDMTGNWTNEQLRDLEHRRDLFENLQMLWWIQEESLLRYLAFWQQLRQLFRIYTLEQELWRGISAEEIESDIDFIQDLSSEKDPEGVRRLQHVLEFLRRGGIQHG